MSDKTTIQVRRDTKDRLEAMKQGSESLDETIRRELGITPQESKVMIDKLVRFLSPENESDVRGILEALRSEFEFEYGVDESPAAPADFALRLENPDTSVPVFIFRSSEEDSFHVSYRGTSGMKDMIDWNGFNKLGKAVWDGFGNEEREELLRLAHGAYETAGET
jgi:predicted CopG family antitoxin